MTIGPSAPRRLTRRAALGLLAVAMATPALAAATPNADIAAKIAGHFSGVRTMQGEFVQFGPRGEQTGGTFFIQRPGKVRFNYEKPATYKVVADGKSVVVSNTKLKTDDLYPLSKTPLKLLLSDRIDLGGDKVKSVKVEDDLVTITMQDKSVFGNATITLMFDPATYELRQWTTTDAQGKDTTVMIFNVQQGVKIPAEYFKIDYAKVAASTDIQKNR